MERKEGRLLAAQGAKLGNKPLGVDQTGAKGVEPIYLEEVRSGESSQEAGLCADGSLPHTLSLILSGVSSSTQLTKYIPDSWSYESRFPTTEPSLFSLPVSPPSPKS